MPAGGHDFYAVGVKQDSTVMSEGPFSTLNQAIQFGDDQMASGNWASYTITYTDAHGNIVEYNQN